MRHFNILIPALLLLFVSYTLGAQDSTAENLTAPLSYYFLTETEQQSAAEALYRASLDPENYPVTPGDVYLVEYSFNNNPLYIEILVDNTYEIDLQYLGRLQARGLTFLQLREIINGIIKDSYPASISRLTLMRTGLFPIRISGETLLTTEIHSNSFQDLYTILQPFMQKNISLRQVDVIDRYGNSKTYDLYRYIYLNEEASNPRLNPGDQIRLYENTVTVKLAGQVNRPGTFEIIEEENLEDLIEIYGRGPSPRFSGEIVLTRYSSETPEGLQQQILYSNNFELPLQDEDTIQLRSGTEHLPYIYFEGAVGSVSAEGPSNRIPLAFTPGESIKEALQSSRDLFSNLSDLKAARILHADGNTEDIDLEAILYTDTEEGNLSLREGDRFIIPFSQNLIYIGGAVNSPGFYPYFSDYILNDYIRQAGGFDLDRHVGDKVLITSLNGVEKIRGEALDPGDIIYAPENNLVYLIFQKYSYIFSTIYTLLNAANTGYNLVYAIFN